MKYGHKDSKFIFRLSDEHDLRDYRVCAIMALFLINSGLDSVTFKINFIKTNIYIIMFT